MINITDKEKCSGCYACASACPVHAISMICDKSGFWYPEVNTAFCTSCGLCERVCTDHVKVKEKSFIPVTYGAFAKDSNIRSTSSSGGIFKLIALEVLRNGGAIVGAAYDKDYKGVHHEIIFTEPELNKLCSSKYTQSRIGTVYIETKKILDTQKLVLFTGTPCQIAGLYSYLRKEYDNLITQDIVCHGVPSPKVWREYAALREKKAISKIKSVSLRQKKTGWRTYSTQFVFNNDTVYSRVHQEDLFMRGFIADLYLRPSCYACKYKRTMRSADITLADFWGIEHIMPEMDDGNGTSLVTLNSPKGIKLFESVASQTQYKSCDLLEAVKYNPAMIKPSIPSINREKFWITAEKKSVEKAINKYCKTPLITRLKKAVKKLVRR